MALDIAKTFLAWILILPASFFVGSLFRGLVKDQPLIFRGIFFFALGITVLSYGIVLLSLSGLLRPAFIWALVLVPFILIRRERKEWRSWWKVVFGSFSVRKKSAYFKIMNLLFLVSFGGLFLATLTPEIGGDALTYHLNLPKVFLRQGSLTPVFLDYNSYFPLLMNNLYLIGLVIGGVPAAKLFHLFCGLLLFIGMRQTIEEKTKNPPLAFFISLVFWVTPAAFNLMSSAYVDVALSLYVFLGVVTFLQALEIKQASLLFLSGLLMGAATAVKYLAVASAAVLPLIWLLDSEGWKKPTQHLRGMVLWSGGFIIVAGYWLVRNALATGNPFFPYFGSLFGTLDRPVAALGAYGVGRGLFDFLFLFWNMSQMPEKFGTFPTRIGLFYFLLVPFAVIAPFLTLKARRLTLFCFSALLLMFFLSQADRWILPILPLFLLLSAFGLQGLHEIWGQSMGRLRRVATIFGISILAVYVLGGLYHYRFAYLPAFGVWSPETYLRKMERTFPVASWINKSLPSDARLLLEFENRQFYFDRPTLRDVFLKWRWRYEEEGWSAEKFRNGLKSLGVTHILTSDVLLSPIVHIYAQLGREGSFIRDIAGSSAKELIQIPSENIRDERVLYRVYELR